jgi:two-component system CitB family sensor kinase
VLHAVHEGLLLLDTQGRLQLANDEARRLLDLPADWAGRSIEDVGLPAVLVQALREQDAVHDDVQLTSARVLVVNQAPARWEGRDLGRVVTVRDHTDLQALTGELDSVRGFAEALRSQAHESANRLHSVVSLIELGRTGQALSFATAELAAAQQLTDTVVAAVDEPVLAALLLGKVAEASERAIELVVDPASAVPEGALAPRDLVTIVGNLLDNALDAAGPAGRVRFSGWVDDVASSVGIASTLVLQVADSGPGLPDAHAELAFTRGWSTKADTRLVGHGLGLALVGQTVHRHGGSVHVQRDDDLGGAAFTVRVPLVAEGCDG